LELTLFRKSNQGWIQDGKLALPPIQTKKVLDWLVKNVKMSVTVFYGIVASFNDAYSNFFFYPNERHSFVRRILSGNPVDKFQKEFMKEFQYLSVSFLILHARNFFLY
jgi:hypothetical protein